MLTLHVDDEEFYAPEQGTPFLYGNFFKYSLYRKR